MSKLDSRWIALPGEEGSVYVVKDGAYVPAISHETWTITLEDDSVQTKEVVIWTSQE